MHTLPGEPYQTEEILEVSSYNHASVQANLAFLFKRLGGYSVLTELSLAGGESGELRPDVCLYPKRGLSRPRDILRMTEMPLLAVEILSPKQGLDDILEKFERYFQSGIKSCWLVDPTLEIIAVYHTSLQQHVIYSQGEVKDEMLGIRLPLAEIFE